jgi:hypothetical protein
MRAKTINESQKRSYEKIVHDIEEAPLSSMFNDKKELIKYISKDNDKFNVVDFKTNELDIDWEVQPEYYIHTEGLEAKAIVTCLYYVEVIGWEDWKGGYDRYALEHNMKNYFKVLD